MSIFACGINARKNKFIMEKIFYIFLLAIAFALMVISCYKRINKFFIDGCFYTWYFHKEKDTIKKEEINKLNHKELNNIYYIVLALIAASSIITANIILTLL